MPVGVAPLRRPRLLRPTWRDSDRFVPRSFVQPALRFMRIEAASGVVVLVAAVAALVWPAPVCGRATRRCGRRSCRSGWATSSIFDLTLRAWVNDAAMALFFLLAGLEIKRQLLLGGAAQPRAAALPALAALGGMVVPALMSTAVNAGGDGSRGWGIPVATDIAFAVGVVALAGKRVPLGARIFILTLAVVGRRRRHRRDRRVLRRVGRPGLTGGRRRDRDRDVAPSRRRRPLAGALIALGARAGYVPRAGIEAAIVGVLFVSHAHPALPRRGPVRTHRPRPRRPDRGDLRRPGPLTEDEAEGDEVTLRGPGAVRQRPASPWSGSRAASASGSACWWCRCSRSPTPGCSSTWTTWRESCSAASSSGSSSASPGGDRAVLGPGGEARPRTAPAGVTWRQSWRSA